MDVEKPKRWEHKLYEEYEHVLFTYRVKLRRPVIRVAPLTGLWGKWDPEIRTITIAERLIVSYGWENVLEILKHEMAHQIVTDHYQSTEAHGELFAHACRRLGVAAWAVKAETDLERPIPQWKDAKEDPESERHLARVEKLLALATSSNEHEALAAMRKVRELYTKYEIDRLESRRASEYVTLILNTRRRRSTRHHFLIASILNEHFFVKVVHSSLYDPHDFVNYKTIELLGSRENVLMAEYVYHFLWNQTRVSWSAYEKQTGAPRRVKGSYCLGMLSGFRSKLDEAEVKPAILSMGTALVVPPDRELEQFVKLRYPRLVSFSRGHGTRDRVSYEAGLEEGRRLVLHKGVHASDDSATRRLIPTSRP